MKIHKTTEVVHYLSIKATEQELKTILGTLLYTVHRIEKHSNKAHILKELEVNVKEIKEIIDDIKNA